MDGISRLKLPKTIFLFLLNCYVLQTLGLGYYFGFLPFQFVSSQFYYVIQLGNFSFSSSIRNNTMFLSFKAF